MPDSIAKQCYDAIVTAIQGAGLTGIESTEVKLRKQYRDKESIYRGISVVPIPEREAPGTNSRDDIAHGALIVMCQGDGHGWTDDIDRVTQWRQSIRRLFNNKRLSVTENFICTWDGNDQFVPAEFQNNRDVSVLVIRAWCREPRT